MSSFKEQADQFIEDVTIIQPSNEWPPVLIKNETISGGMIPKINNCLDVANNGVKGVCIIDGRQKHSILFELLSDKGSGTLIRS